MKIALAVVSILLVDAYLANVRARRAVQKMSDVGMYLAQKLDENEIEFTEFDKIAVQSLVD